MILREGATEWEIEREREEFSRASSLYRPLAGMMAMRFTSGGSTEDDNKPETRTDGKVCRKVAGLLKF